MYEYTVPQEFNQNDRIGNFTMPQAFILGAGVLIVLLMMASGMNIVVALIIDIPILIATVYLMYKKKFDVPIYEFAMVYLVYKATPKLLIYRKENMREEYEDEEMLFLIADEDEVVESVKPRKPRKRP